MSLTSQLYSLGRMASKAGSVMTDAKNISQGRIDKVAKKQVKKQAYKGLSSILRKL